MTDQQVLTYQRWLYEGTARLEPMAARPGWCWLLVRQGTQETRVRALGPRNVKRLRKEY